MSVRPQSVKCRACRLGKRCAFRMSHRSCAHSHALRTGSVDVRDASLVPTLGLCLALPSPVQYISWRAHTKPACDLRRSQRSLKKGPSPPVSSSFSQICRHLSLGMSEQTVPSVS